MSREIILGAVVVFCVACVSLFFGLFVMLEVRDRLENTADEKKNKADCEDFIFRPLTVLPEKTTCPCEVCLSRQLTALPGKTTDEGATEKKEYEDVRIELSEDKQEQDEPSPESEVAE